MEEFLYSTQIASNMILFVCGLLLMATILSSIKKFPRFTLGKIFIFISGAVVMVASALRIFSSNESAFDVLLAFSFLLFSLGISFFYKKPLWAPRKKREEVKKEKKLKIKTLTKL